MQDPALSLTLHSALDPHGDGLQGSRFSGSIGAMERILVLLNNHLKLRISKSCIVDINIIALLYRTSLQTEKGSPL